MRRLKPAATYCGEILRRKLRLNGVADQVGVPLKQEPLEIAQHQDRTDARDDDHCQHHGVLDGRRTLFVSDKLSQQASPGLQHRMSLWLAVEPVGEWLGDDHEPWEAPAPGQVEHLKGQPVEDGDW